MNKHDPLNRNCLQNCVVNRGARVSCTHLHHDCNCAAQKEELWDEMKEVFLKRYVNLDDRHNADVSLDGMKHMLTRFFH